MSKEDSRHSSRDASRNASPIRPGVSNTVSSSQPPAHASTATTLQRALSASSLQQVQQQQQRPPPPPHNPVSDAPPQRKPRDLKSTSSSGQTTPQWPVSPRLKSPPPSGLNTKRGSANATPRKLDPVAAPNITVHNATPTQPSATPREPSTKEGTRQEPSPQLQAPPKPLSRGPSGKSTLETVQENSADAIAEPSPAVIQASADLKPLTKISDADKQARKSEAERNGQPGESGSESAGNKSDPSSRTRRTSVNQAANNTQRSKNNSVKGNFPASAKRHAEGKQGMTVETEVVQSIPQAALTAGDRSSRNEGGSVRLKPSNETIRPKKERKKTERKTRSVNQGSAASKADLFEARVASAVDEANTSDSDETFVYESNPPEHQRRQRHHSRTPSVTSAHSVAEGRNGAIRSFGEAFEDRKVAGKRSMKFSSNPYHDVDSPDSKDGTVRTHTPRHIGRYGRGGHHATPQEPDSPFTQASKGRNSHLSAQSHSRSRPGSPKSPQSMQYRSNGLFSKKPELSYDFDAEQNADDERTPLITSMRMPRGSRYVSRDGSGGMYSTPHEYAFERHRRWLPGKVGACLLTSLIVIMVVTSAVGFAFMSNQPLRNVEIRKIENVLASRQELMLDLLVSAVNPNTLGISVSDMDLTLLAKSRHGNLSTTANGPTQRQPRQRGPEYNPNPSQDPSGHWTTPSSPGHDHGTDPDDDHEIESQTMLLGRVLSFDQPLSFDASPFRRRELRSLGQLRLMRPGNESEAGGAARWEQIIQYPFELIVRGVLVYQLPISAHVQRVAVGASIVVHPEDGIDKQGRMRTTPVDHSDDWQWIEWPDILEDEDDEDVRRKR